MAFLTIEELNSITNIASSGAFSTYELFVMFVVANKTAIENLTGRVGINRDEIRNVLAYSIEQQTNELLGQSTMSNLTLREIFLDLIQNQSGDPIRFDTVPLDDSEEDDRGKYFVEE